MGVTTGELMVTCEYQWPPINLRIKSKFLYLAYECPIPTR